MRQIFIVRRPDGKLVWTSASETSAMTSKLAAAARYGDKWDDLEARGWQCVQATVTLDLDIDDSGAPVCPSLESLMLGADVTNAQHLLHA